MICRPLLDYAAILFHNPHPITLRNIQVAERSALRVLTKIRHPQNPLHNPSNILLYERTNVTPIETRLSLLSEKFATNAVLYNILRPLLITRNANTIPKRPLTTIHDFISPFHTTSDNE